MQGQHLSGAQGAKGPVGEWMEAGEGGSRTEASEASGWNKDAVLPLAAQPQGRWGGDSALSGLPQERGGRLLTGRRWVSLATSSSSTPPPGAASPGTLAWGRAEPPDYRCQGSPSPACSPSSASQVLCQPHCSP
ncbi:alpha-2-macroglobulin-like [Platysternon megacephalum]|uniref:Alpha-2-macroglobulin-like n=1 Tax=Platysternon megacephalum TaxID=55544 RepID=A0A4D9DT88_9SAUR|nr:alpha-2-macroglobulin-like [Platysternon megacephalum]